MNEQHSGLQSEDKLMTDQETADFLRIKFRQLFDWRMKGLIPFVKIGKALRYRKSDILAAVDRMTIGRSSTGLS